MNAHRIILATGAALPLVLTAAALAQSAPSGSLMARYVADAPPQAQGSTPHALRDGSLFALAPPDIRIFAKHDLVHIIVRESSKAESTQELETKKEFKVDGKISAFPHLSLSDLLQLQLRAGSGNELPAVGLDLGKDFKGEGDYKREDDFTARLTAEVVDILPNGNLVLEARTSIKTDEEISTILVTGICRPEDVDAANTVVSSRVHDLQVEKVNSGELKKANKKGIVTKFFDFLFAF